MTKLWPGCVFGLVSVLSAVGNGGQAVAQPNVIVIVADDAGYADWGFMDGVDGSNPTPSPIPTPNLDALAARGVKFSRAYVGQSCQPTRAAIITGGYQNRIGNEVVGNNIQGLPASATTLWDRMGGQGYTTGAIGKWHLGSVAGPQGNRPETQGVDEFYGIWHGSRNYNLGNTNLQPTQLLREVITQPNGTFTDTVIEGNHRGEYFTNTMGDFAVDFITDHHDDAEPFVLYQSFTAPHTPLQNSPDFNDPRIAGLSGIQKTYASMMLTMDKEIGRMMDRLDDPNGDGNSSDSIKDDTLVIFVNDNGGAHSGSSSPNGADNGLLRAGKGSSFEGGIRVPMIIAGAGVDAAVHGTTYDKNVHGVDILPTAFAAAGGTFGPGDTGIDGVNLLPFINGTDTSDPHEVLVNRHRKQFAVIKGDLRLVNNGGSSTSNHQLYNVATDIGQTNNIAGSNPALVAELERDLTHHEVEFDKQRYAILGQTAEATINTFDHFVFNPTQGGGAGGDLTIIDGATGDGDFEAPGAGSGSLNFTNHANWFNAGGTETINFSSTTQTNGSSQAGSRAAMPFQDRTQVNNTGHTVATAGETFSLTYDFGAGGALANWNGDETMRVFLFTSPVAVDGSLDTGDITEIASTSYAVDRANDGQWTTFSANNFYTTTAADIGKELFLGMVFEDLSGSTLFPRLDVLSLSATVQSTPSTATNWSSSEGWFEGGTSNVETMFNSDAFAGAVLEFGTTDAFSYISNNDMVRETGLEFMLNKMILSGTFGGASNQTATIQGNELLFTDDLDGNGPEIAVNATNDGANSFAYGIDLDVVMYDNLTVGGDGDVSVTINGQIRDYYDPRNLTKSGTSTVVLAGSNAYEGDTIVEGGTLTITSAYLEESADVYLTTGAVFDLDFAGIDSIDELFFDGVSQAIGTWGSIGSGADNESAFFNGTGLLLVSTIAILAGDYNDDGSVDAADYTVWADNFGSTTLLDADGNNDGVVDAADYTIWADNFGASRASAQGLLIPEPCTAIVLFAGLLGLSRRR